MKQTFQKKSICALIAVVAFLFCAPLWQPHFRELNGRNIFLTVDSVVLLASLLLFALLFALLMPRRFLPSISSFSDPLRKQLHWSFCLAIPLIFLSLVAVNRVILHQFMNSADEHSCYFLAETLRMGRWWIPPHPLSEFFDVVHVGNKVGKWFSVYPPGWPALMAVGLQLGVEHLMNPLISTLALIFLFLTARKLFGVSVAWFSVICTAITPFFLFTGASYFSHPTCLLAMSIFSYAYLKWCDSKTAGKRQLWATIGAFAIGYGLATRYLTMAAFCAPFLIYRFLPIILKKEKFRKDHAIVIGVVAIFMLIIYYQNFSVSGNIFKAPNRFDKSWERLGFRDFYTPLDGIIYFMARLFYLSDWAPPIYIIFYFMTLFQKRLFTMDQRLFRFSFFYPVIAYFLYFSWGGESVRTTILLRGFPFLNDSSF